VLGRIYGVPEVKEDSIFVYMVVCCVAAPNISSIFGGKFREYFGRKIESFQNFAKIFQNSAKNVILKFWPKWTFCEHSICNFSTNFFWGGREIAQEWGEILSKVSPKHYAQFWENFVSTKFHQNRNTSGMTVYDVLQLLYVSHNNNVRRLSNI